MPSSPGSVPSYLGLSIFNLLCCCLPLGIAAVIFSHQTMVSNNSGDVNMASQSSRIARRLNIAGIVIGLIMIIILSVLYAVLFSRIK